ncbi:MAG: 6-phosphofructokinase [Terracidiphilus sp.]
MPAKKPFLSYKFVDEQREFADQRFVDWVYFMLSKQGLDPFYWPLHGRAGDLNQELAASINECDGMVALFGEVWGGMQAREIEHFLSRQNGRPFVPVLLVKNLPHEARSIVHNLASVTADALEHSYEFAGELAGKIARMLGLQWVPEDGLPNCYVVDNEKEFLDRFRRNDEALLTTLRTRCGWTRWPSIEKKEAALENPITDKSIGTLSDDSPRVMLDARGRAEADGAVDLSLPEARPRTHLRYPLQPGAMLGIGILVSGGIAPGINAVIDGIVLRHSLYHARQCARGRRHSIEILGYREGFKGLLRPGVHPQRLNSAAIRGVVEIGGSYLGTSRADELLPGTGPNRNAKLEAAIGRLQNDGVHILYVIGGDGSMSCAHALWHYARRKGYELSVVGIPKAMDNDILWVWQSFGFLSAVEEARQAILHMHTEVSSNPRVGIVQLFGSDSGFIASHAGYSTACDLVLIPEDPMTMDDIVTHISERLTDRFGNGQDIAGPYALVVMAETALPADARKYIDDPRVGLSEGKRGEKEALKSFLDNGRRVRGQTPDELRTAGLKIVSRVLQDRIQQELEPREYWRDFRVITNEPRHLIRSIPPSVTDVIFGERLGALAVDNAMAGYTDFMVSQWLTEFVLVPLPLVVLGRKRVPTNGIFWKSVLSKTGQRL